MNLIAKLATYSTGGIGIAGLCCLPLYLKNNQMEQAQIQEEPAKPVRNKESVGTLLSEEPSFSGYGSNSLGRKYGKYMLSLKDENDLTWSWIYSQNSIQHTKDEESAKSEKFKQIIGDSEKKYTDMKKVCEEAYKETLENIKTEENYEDDVWKYCSYIGQKITTVTNEGNSTYGSGKIGSKYSGKLISVKDDENDTFWNKQDALFFDVWGNEATENSEFHTLFKSKNGSEHQTQKLKNKCKEAYESEENNSKFPEKDILNFCALQFLEN